MYHSHHIIHQMMLSVMLSRYYINSKWNTASYSSRRVKDSKSQWRCLYLSDGVRLRSLPSTRAVLNVTCGRECWESENAEDTHGKRRVRHLDTLNSSDAHWRLYTPAASGPSASSHSSLTHTRTVHSSQISDTSLSKWPVLSF